MKLLLLFLLLELSLFASIGKISALNGKVTVDRQSQLLDANLGFDLEEKDLVLTDDKSKAQITLNDGTVLSLGKNSKLNINEYVFDEKNSSNSKAEFKFVEGTFKSITGAIGKVAPEKFKLETKSASIGIRGTIVVGNQEKVACTQGQITVTSAGVTQVLGAGMMTNTEIGKPPTQPTKIEGNLLKEVDTTTTKDGTNSSSNGNKVEESKSSESSNQNNNSEQSSSLTSNDQSSSSSNKIESNIQSNPVLNISTITEIAKTTTETTNTTQKLQNETTLLVAEQKKAELMQLATELVNESSLISKNINSSLITLNTAKQTATETLNNVSASAFNDAESAVQSVNEATLAANQFSIQGQTFSNDILGLLEKMKTVNISEAQTLYEQIQAKIDSLNMISSQISEIANIAFNSSKAVVNTLSYSTAVNISEGQSVGSKIFTISKNNTTVTISTYTVSLGMDPVLILLKKNSNGEYVTINNGRNDDSWISSPNWNNAILNLELEAGEYMITVGDFPFNSNQSIESENNSKNDYGEIKLHITSSDNLIFQDTSVEKYSYITKLNNQAYINNLNYTSAKIEENNAYFGVLADSNVGKTIKINDYGYFVTISDSFNYEDDIFLNTTEIDNGSSWGYWTQSLNAGSNSIDMQSVWVSGNKVTPSTNYSYNFSGQVIGSVSNGSNTGYIKLDSNNLFQATIDIGSSSITNSIIKFNDSLGASWNGSFNTAGSNVNTSGFSANITNNISNSISSSENSLSSINPPINNVSGSLSGNYYGVDNQVKSIGGSFNMTQGSSIANGVFKAGLVGGNE